MKSFFGNKVVVVVISITPVRLKFQANMTRPNGGMGAYWNFHIIVEEIFKFVLLHMKYLFFLFLRPVFVSFLSDCYGLNILLKVGVANSTFSSHV